MQFELRPSRTFITLLFTVHLLAMMSVTLTYLPVWARIGIVLLIAASLLNHLYLRNGQRWRSFALDARRVTVTTIDGAVLKGELTEQTLVIEHCVVLCARFEDARFIVGQVVFPDAMKKEAFRELRVRLKLA